LTGVARNDPNPATAPFTQNLAAAAEIMAYPNLATRAAAADPGDQHGRAAEADADADRRAHRHSIDAIKGLPASPPPTGQACGIGRCKTTRQAGGIGCCQNQPARPYKPAAISPAPAATSADMPAAPPAPSDDSPLQRGL